MVTSIAQVDLTQLASTTRSAYVRNVAARRQASRDPSHDEPPKLGGPRGTCALGETDGKPARRTMLGPNSERPARNGGAFALEGYIVVKVERVFLR